jgi:hypothetical protein
VPKDESASEICLHCEINEVVREHIEGQETIDIADLAAWKSVRLRILEGERTRRGRELPARHRVESPGRVIGILNQGGHNADAE